MPSIGDFQIIGLRAFGQLQEQQSDGDWSATVFHWDGTVADVTLESTVATDNTIVPTTPPSGFTGFGDLVLWTRDTPAGSAAAWPGPSKVTTTVLFTHHAESGNNYWVLYLPEELGFVLAFEGEVTLLTPAL